MKNKNKIQLLLFLATILLAGLFNVSPASAADNCFCSSGGAIPGYYARSGSFEVADLETCKNSCKTINDAKYFSFSNSSNLIYSRIYNCLCVQGSNIPFYYPLDSKYDVADDDACHQQCANKRTEYYSFSNYLNLGTQKVTKSPSGETNEAPLIAPYILLETLPGFFEAGDTMTDFPALVLAIYKFGIWTVGIAALFMIVIGGIMYMGSAGNTSTANSAKGIIKDALIGVATALTAYMFLYVINPDLVRINLDLTPVQVSDAEDEEVAGTMYGSLTTIDGQQVETTIASSIQKIERSGVNLIVTSGLRTVEKQQQLISQNCKGGKCSPPTCLLKNGPSSCPHTTGRAVDAWALNPSGRQAIMQSDCQRNISACFNNKYQKALIAAMKAEGFCVLSSEPWHFEKPKMSSKCN